MAFGIPAALMLGLLLLMGSIGLFFIGRLKPNLRRDSDNVLAILGVISSIILMTHLGLEFSLVLQQILMISALVTLVWENLRLRGLLGEKQVRRPGTRAGTGSREPAPRPTYYQDAELDEEPPSRRAMDYDRYDRGGRTALERNQRRPLRPTREPAYDPGYDTYEEEAFDRPYAGSLEAESTSRPANRRPRPEPPSPPPAATQPRRPRPQYPPRRRPAESNGDYGEPTPVGEATLETDNSNQFDA
ncbi:MAG: hypothetical protein IGQ88_06075 [Gloeomargaritaceae cyanobacterium C42_A2020_066]|nr:hypothetical protein [Gloeomargaritaceae cyanobacterium C42_A2020_066]